MPNKPQPIEIPSDDPFLNDKLNRKGSAELLNNLLQTTKGPFVLSLTSSWGRGKTTFIHMWSELLRGKAPTLYFNAWSTDFSNDPLLSFIGEIESQINSDKLNISKSSKAKEVFGRVTSSGTKIVKTFTPLAVKLMTLGTMNSIDEIKDVFDFDPTSDDSVSDFLAKLTSDKLNEYKSQKEHLKRFRDNLEEFSSVLKNEETGLPLIIFVDELDRCKPTYAIELLETIKHIFSVPGVVFVLSIDREQLENSLKSIYGADLDTHGYLARFIDLEYILPDPKNDDLVHHVHDLNGIHDLLTSKGYSNEENDHIIFTMTCMTNILSLPSRIIEQCYTQLQILLSIIPSKNKDQYSMLYLPLILILKSYDKSLYNDNKSRPINILSELASSYNLPSKLFSQYMGNHNYGIALQFFSQYRSKHSDNINKRFAALNTKGEFQSNENIEFHVLAEIKSGVGFDFHEKTKKLIEMNNDFVSS